MSIFAFSGSRRRHFPARVSWFSDTRRAARAGLCCLAVLGASAGVAHAEDERPTPIGDRSGFSFDLALSAGAASAEFTESDYPVADFQALALELDARWGWFVSRHLLLGGAFAISWHAGMGNIYLKDVTYFSNEGAPRHGFYEVYAPLGVFAEFYPLDNEGLFIGIGGAIGLMALPGFSTGDGDAILSGYAFEAGYELSRYGKLGPALFVRYRRWAAEEFSYVEEHPDGLLSTELSIGVRWTFGAREWR
jgi:hypothetical protein